MDFLKYGNKTTIWPSNPTSEHIPRENHNSKRYMYPNVHSSTIYNSQDTRTRKQPIYPSTDEWIKKLWFTIEYHAASRGTNLSRGSEVDEPTACCTEWSKSEREKQIHINTYMWNLEKWYWWTYCTAGVKNRLVDTVGKGKSGTNRENSTDKYTTVCRKMLEGSPCVERC